MSDKTTHDAAKSERMASAAARLVGAGYAKKALEILREYGESTYVALYGDGNAVEYPEATSRSEAAEMYVDGGEWGTQDETEWVHITTWGRWRLGDVEIDGRDRDVDVRVELAPDEPPCVDGHDHEWRDDPDHSDQINGGGMICYSRCEWCGLGRIHDSWAQDRETGEQGLDSIRYDREDYCTDGPADGDDKPSAESEYEAVACYVETCDDGGEEGACNVHVGVAWAGDGWRRRWYVSTWDDAGGSDEADDTAYETEAAAVTAAEELAAARDEGDGTESAEGYLARRRVERAGEPDPRGEWAVAWSTVGEDGHIVDRYPTQDAAEAACDIAEAELRERHPGGQLLCGHVVLHLIGGKWESADDDGGE